MYNLHDTIVAVSSPPLGERSIIRISGPNTSDVLQQIFNTKISEEKKGGVTAASLSVDGMRIDARLYIFPAPHSYTGETLAEIHIYTNSSVIEVLLKDLLGKGLRMAGPGEFTARAYLNGKLDLAQAEAVNEIIVSSNRFQLAAAEKILRGKLAQTTEKILAKLMDCISLIEAGLDFSGEDIEFISREEATERLSQIKNQLEQLLKDSISCESVLDLPAVGIAGAPNSGKSSLLNKLAGYERSIVSSHRKTTRDVLTSVLTLRHCRCVIFDCAGLISTAENLLDELAQQAAAESLQNSSIVIFCVDASKEDWSEDISIRQLITPQAIIPVATKSDLLTGKILTERIAELNKSSGADFLITSAKTDTGLEQLRDIIDEKLTEQTLGGSRNVVEQASGVAVTARHRQAITEAIENIDQAINELNTGNDEITAMLLRTAYQSISRIEQHVDEEILERIFSRFCIGK